MSRMEMREKWWKSIYNVLIKQAKSEKRFLLQVRPPPQWKDVDSTDFAHLAQDLDDAIEAINRFEGPKLALRLTREQYEVMKEGMSKIKYGPWEHYEKPEEPIHRICMYCDGPVNFLHWLQDFRRARAITREEAVRIWNNEFVVITCCYCTGLPKEQLLEKLEKIALERMKYTHLSDPDTRRAIRDAQKKLNDYDPWGVKENDWHLSGPDDD